MENIEQKFKVLGDANRFKIVNLLLGHDYCVSALAQHLGISKPAISQHLQVLRRAGLVRGEKRGYWTHYMVERDMLRQMAETLANMARQPAQCCGEGPCNHIHEGKGNIGKHPIKS